MKRFPNDLLLRALNPEEILTGRALYRLVGPFVFTSLLLGTITVPDGFITDFASIPRPAMWYIDDDDPGILFPSVIHDYLYSLRGTLPTSQPYTREMADQVLREGMQICGARADQVTAVYWAVRLGGGSHWNS